MGFSLESAEKTQEMLLSLPNWSNQYETGQTGARLKREDKVTLATGLPDLDIDNRPGKQRGSQGKQKDIRSQAIFPVTIPKGNPQQGPRSRSDLTGLRMFEEASKTDAQAQQQNCKPRPKPRSPEQRQSTQQAQQAAQQQGQTFDNMPKPQVQEMAKQGGQAERKPQLPTCPN